MRLGIVKLIMLNIKRVTIAFAVASLLAGCGKNEVTPAAKTAPASPVAVSVIPVRSTNWPDVYEATGTVRARMSSAIASRMTGQVREVRVNLGDRVSAGQVLVVLDAEGLDAASSGSEAALAEARSAQPEIESAVTAAKAQLDLAQITFGRMRDLFAKKSISNQEFDEASAKLKVAEANYAMAMAKREQLAGKIAQAEQGVRSARINRSYSTIVAPFAGIVAEKSIEPGMLATPGAPLITIEQAGAWRLEASVEESRLANIRRGQAVEVQIESLGRTVDGRISEIVPAVDPASRTATVKIDLPQVADLRGGQFGRARFKMGQREVLAIPANAVAERGQLQNVYIATENTARARMVTLGARNGDQVEVLSGLTAGDTLIYPIPSGLSEGSPIVPSITGTSLNGVRK